ncbi:MAG: hypothetical protein LBC07_02490 [Elusimicrobiota bacterium]|jgi:DNA polymerase-3 subunit delta'|nr:hypothetical protein [Elusimicrobiota bacterium]
MFEYVLGQDNPINLKKVDDILSSQIIAKKVSHAYLFLGQDFVLKRLCAIEFVKTLNCLQRADDSALACGKCNSCMKISKDIHPDIHFIDFQKQAQLNNKPEDFDVQNKQKKNLGIDIITQHLLPNVFHKAVEAKWKAFIIDPADKLTIEANNALLKTLEEPPDNTIMILLATSRQALPATIVSRCQPIFFKPLADDQVANYIFSLSMQSVSATPNSNSKSKKSLAQNKVLTQSQANQIASLSDGSIGKALQLMTADTASALKIWDKFCDGSLKEMAVCDIIELADEITKDNAAESIDALIFKAKGSFKQAPFKVFEVLELLNSYKQKLLQNANAQTLFEVLLMNMARL